MSLINEDTDLLLQMVAIKKIPTNICNISKMSFCVLDWKAVTITLLFF